MLNFKESLKNIPKPIRLFLGKALLFFVVWKLAYGFYFSHTKVLDYPLTKHVGEASTYLLNNFSPMSGFTVERTVGTFYIGEELVEGGVSSQIFHNDYLVLHIADNCNGLELLVLFIGFIICMPSSFWRKVLYIVIGCIIIDFVNILRCMGLIYLREYYHAYFDFAHHYLFKAAVYTCTFLMWMYFSRKISFKNENLQVG
ncbi:hypothetical protein PK35_04055 [Tamlana nanhaiensis]|uniref:Exosortase n=1 Tax=Neotamlana nanhaiensis TaxID=1382798 RepID=A0A0D7W5E0_9FLAO|nr:archaeosortase/exosortase family protein [Tamlana nanhaiensis]KJD33918.1 hypothetical protein PK35_04055 [Tamlana nanhaiensis]